MAALVEGRSYGLSSLMSTSAGKTALHVKLTDSALKAIEEFQAIQHATSRRPKFQCHGHQGVLQVPIKKSSCDPEGWKSFSFTLSSIQGDFNGTFDCVQQNAPSRGGSDLELVGGMSHKMTIHATDDVYNTTRVRMKNAEEESKKNCAVEIKPVGKYIPKVVKRVIKPHAKSSSHPPNQEVLKNPLRDRIIHLLARRAHTKPEIMMRLQRDGLREKDRNQIGNVLSQVGHFHIKDNSYTLQHNLHNEVNLEWPGYRDEVKQMLKRRPSAPDNGSATHCPAAISLVHSNNSNSSPSQKRSGEDVIKPVAKKARVTHVWKTADDDAVRKQKQPPPQASAAAGVATKAHRDHYTLSVSTAKDINPLLSQENQHPAKSRLSNGKIGVDNEDIPADYLSSYTQITNSDQRKKYKQDFNAEYEEYKQLHCNLEKKTRIFSELKDKLRLEEEKKADETVVDIKNRILHEYKQLHGDQNYLEQRRRRDYLHKKLDHIKTLITTYDNSDVE